MSGALANPVNKFVSAVLECSVYHAPRTPGLTYQELREACVRAGFLPGETDDAIAAETLVVFGRPSRLLPKGGHAWQIIWLPFGIAMDPEYRNPAAFDFVLDEMDRARRTEGARNARIERDVLVERAVAAGLGRNDVEVAITAMVFQHQLKADDTTIAPNWATKIGPSCSERHAQARPAPGQNELRAKAYEIVRDIVARRADGRPSHAEPLDAFAEALKDLGHPGFRTWWTQIVGELRRADPAIAPVSTTVLAAAIVEGALTFAVARARGSQLGLFGSRTFEEPPRMWRIEDLVSGAAAGGANAILDDAARNRARELIKARQRIHAGRMIEEHPGGMRDLRSEEARAAKETANIVARKVLDWMQAHRPA